MHPPVLWWGPGTGTVCVFLCVSTDKLTGSRQTTDRHSFSGGECTALLRALDVRLVLDGEPRDVDALLGHLGDVPARRWHHRSPVLDGGTTELPVLGGGTTG